MTNYRKGFIVLAAIATLLVAYLVFQSGRGTYFPKPKGYFQIQLPEKKYMMYTSDCLFNFEVLSYGKIELMGANVNQDSCKFNIAYPGLNARIHCTYLPINNNFDALGKEAYGMAVSHEMKASALKRTKIADDARKVYGILYDIEGEAASQIQFYLTDSSHHFFRGALYFYNTPNPDSIAPVLNFIREDIVHLTETMQWR